MLKEITQLFIIFPHECFFSLHLKQLYLSDGCFYGDLILLQFLCFQISTCLSSTSLLLSELSTNRNTFLTSWVFPLVTESSCVAAFTSFNNLAIYMLAPRINEFPRDLIMPRVRALVFIFLSLQCNVLVSIAACFKRLAGNIFHPGVNASLDPK